MIISLRELRPCKQSTLLKHILRDTCNLMRHCCTYVMLLRCSRTIKPWRMPRALMLPSSSLMNDSLTSWGEDETKALQNDAESPMGGHPIPSSWTSVRFQYDEQVILIPFDVTSLEHESFSFWTLWQAAGSPSSHRTGTDASSTPSSTTDPLIAACGVQCIQNRKEHVCKSIFQGLHASEC